MFARLSARVILLAAGMALVFFGVGLIGLGIAAALTPLVGAAWGDVSAGGLFLLPLLIWALAIVSIRPPRRAENSGARQIMAAIFAALAKETPWIAVVGAGLAGITELFLNRNKSRK